MRCITYAGETVLTTDDVAQALVTLTAAVANDGQAEAVRIPIVIEDTGEHSEAELVIGVGNDVLSAPTDWDGEAPDFSDAAVRLRAHRSFPRRADSADETQAGDQHVSDAHWDIEFDGFRTS
ncbi:hypothetical protein [Microbacterium hatanonis]|uniref:Uncharacterized protein n=1 Tax=Microbacterium hatanonis TaxID=404366 RepID=A0A5C8I069_9MICO|nr:hypothetical protein [Microbacterium hatanonis]TXK12297.1 hypothetical protein FVP77_02105 [Microbacterium hatanonis]